MINFSCYFNSPISPKCTTHVFPHWPSNTFPAFMSFVLQLLNYKRNGAKGLKYISQKYSCASNGHRMWSMPLIPLLLIIFQQINPTLCGTILVLAQSNSKQWGGERRIIMTSRRRICKSCAWNDLVRKKLCQKPKKSFCFSLNYKAFILSYE